MPGDKEFPTGLFVNRPRPNPKTGEMPPPFIIGRIRINIEDFQGYLSQVQDREFVDGSGFITIEIKQSRTKTDEDNQPKWFAETDTWVKPSERVKETEEEEEEDGDGLPF